MDNVFSNDPAVTNINGTVVAIDGPSFYMKDNCLFIDDVDLAPIQIYCVVSQRSNISKELKISLMCSSQLYDDVQFTFFGNSITATFQLSTDFNTVKHFAQADMPFNAEDTHLNLEIEFRRLEADNSTITTLNYARKQKHIIAYASSSGTLKDLKRHEIGTASLKNTKENKSPLKRAQIRSTGIEDSKNGMLSIDDVDHLTGTNDVSPISIFCDIHFTNPGSNTKLELSASCVSNIYEDFDIQINGNEISIIFQPSADTSRKIVQHEIQFTGDPGNDINIWFYQSPTSLIPQSYAGKQKHIILYGGIHTL